MHMPKNLLVYTLAGVGISVSPLSAQDGAATRQSGSVTYFAGVGTANITAGEYVYDGDYKLSQLDWESKGVKTATIGGEVEIGYSWKLKGRVDVGVGGNGFMEDRDWLDTTYPDWTHQSLHPDTDIDRYINVLLEAERAVIDTGATRVNIGGGVGYTNVKWTARGGSYIYSDVTLYDTVGNFQDGQKVITYEQRIPTIFLSAGAEQRIGALTLSGTLRGGAAIGYKGVDDHWLRDLRFTDTLDPAPMLGATVTADYKVLQSTSIYVGGDFQKIFKTRGDAHVRNTVTGASASFEDGAAAEFQSIMITAGVKGTF